MVDDRRRRGEQGSRCQQPVGSAKALQMPKRKKKLDLNSSIGKGGGRTVEVDGCGWLCDTDGKEKAWSVAAGSNDSNTVAEETILNPNLLQFSQFSSN